MESKKIQIQNQKLLLVEGKDDEVFFKAFLEKKNINEIQVISSDGNRQLQQLFPIIKKTPGFDKVTSLAVIHDADTDPCKAFQSICSVLKNNGMNIPDKLGKFILGTPKVGVFIIPDGKSEGNLESLCLSTVESKNIIKCIDLFMDCIKKSSKNSSSRYKPPKNIDKARCRAFLSAMEEDTSSLGIATQKSYWDLNSEKLNPLLHFLKEL